MSARELLDDPMMNATFAMDEPLPTEAPTLMYAREIADTHCLVTEGSLLQCSTIFPRSRTVSSVNNIVKALSAHDATPHMISEQQQQTPRSKARAVSSSSDAFDPQVANALLVQQNIEHTRNFHSCVSTLTVAQHLRYRDAVIKYIESGGKFLLPKTTAREEQLPDLETVIDYVIREQNRNKNGYRPRMQAEAKKCAICAKYHGECRSIEHCCLNHNFVNDEVLSFGLSVLEAKGKRGHALVAAAASYGDSSVQPQWEVTLVSTSAESHIPLVVQSRELDAPVPPPSAAAALSDPPIPPCRQLRTDVLPSLLRVAIDSTITDPIFAPSLRLSREVLGKADSPKIIMTRSSLTAICTAHFASCTTQFVLPLRVVRDNSSAARTTLRAIISKPLVVADPDGNENVSRRAISTTVLKRLALHDRRFFGDQEEEEPLLPPLTDCFNEVKISSSNNGSGDVYGQPATDDGNRGNNNYVSSAIVRSRVAVHKEGETITMIKLEYSSKDFATAPDASMTYYFEEFSKRELAAMIIATQCHPQAMIRVLRVNVFTCAVIGIEWHSAETLKSVVGDINSDVELSSMWSVAHHVLRDICVKCNAVGSYFLVKSLHSKTIRAVPAAQFKCGGSCAVEPSSDAVCRREYLEPCVWRHPERVPFTFVPRDDPSLQNFVINRTRSSFSATEMRDNDVYTNYSSIFEVEGS